MEDKGRFSIAHALYSKLRPHHRQRLRLPLNFVKQHDELPGSPGLLYTYRTIQPHYDRVSGPHRPPMASMRSLRHSPPVDKETRL